MWSLVVADKNDILSFCCLSVCALKAPPYCLVVWLSRQVLISVYNSRK